MVKSTSYLMSSERIRKSFSSSPTFIFSSSITCASSHTFDSNETALHLFKENLLDEFLFIYFFLTLGDLLHSTTGSDASHILRGRGSGRSQVDSPSCRTPSCPWREPCWQQIRTRSRSSLRCFDRQRSWWWWSPAPEQTSTLLPWSWTLLNLARKICSY